MSLGDPVLEMTGVQLGYGHQGIRQSVLDGVDLVVYRGEAIGIWGPSGSGKSTLLRVAAGIEPPDSGTVCFGAGELWRSRRSGRMQRQGNPNGYVMSVSQDPLDALDPRWSIARSLAEPLLVGRRKTGRQQRSQLIAEHLDAVGLSHLSGQERPGELSIGQCQRVAIIRALLAQPRLLVADEPTSALDVMSAVGVARLLRTATEGGVALLIVSHDVDLLQVLCDRTHRLEAGRLLAD